MCILIILIYKINGHKTPNCDPATSRQKVVTQ